MTERYDRWSDAVTPLSRVAQRLGEFNRARDWEQFHNPKDLAICLAGEAAEVLELFLWKPPQLPQELEALEHELADVLICTVNLAQRAGIDLTAAVERKIALNAEKYPVETARGTAQKYTTLVTGDED